MSNQSNRAEGKAEEIGGKIKGTVGVGQTVHLSLEKGSIVSVTSVKW